MAHDLKAHSLSWRANYGSHGRKSIPLTSHVRTRREQRVGLSYQTSRLSSSEAPPPKGFIIFQNNVTS